MERVKKYIRVIAIMAVAAGLLYGIAVSYRIGFHNSILEGLKFGITWGIIMALILIPLDYLMTKKIPVNALNVHQEREIQVKGALDETFFKCAEMLKRCETIKSVSSSKEALLISGRTRASLVSFGEKIILRFQELTNGIVEIQISSNPVVRFTLLDYGKNFRNVELIRKKIEGILEKNRDTSQ